MEEGSEDRTDKEEYDKEDEGKKRRRWRGLEGEELRKEGRGGKIG
jgi:hypothetical protein